MSNHNHTTTSVDYLADSPSQLKEIRDGLKPFIHNVLNFRVNENELVVVLDLDGDYDRNALPMSHLIINHTVTKCYKNTERANEAMQKMLGVQMFRKPKMDN